MAGQWRRKQRRRAVARRVAPLLAVLGTLTVLVVLIVGAVSQVSPASGPYRSTVDRGYAALAAPLVARSNTIGRSLANFLAQVGSVDRVQFFSRLDSLSTAASELAHHFEGITPPYPSNDVAAMCTATMEDRAKAVSSLRGSLERLLGGSTGAAGGSGNQTQALSAIQGTGALIENADSSWESCRTALRRAPGSARLAASVWVTDLSAWTQGALATLVSDVASSRSLEARPGLVVLSAVTSPPPAPAPGPAGGLLVPPTTSLRVNVVVRDGGNVDEPSVTVTGSVTSASAPSPARARSTVSASREATVALGAGSSVALAITGLTVLPGASYTLEVVATSTDVTSPTTSIPIQIEPAVSTTTVLSSSPSAVVGQRVTYKATIVASVNGLSPTTGTVEFEDDGSPIPSCSPLPVSNGSAACATSYPAKGTHAITALYSGDQSRSASTSSPLIENITAGGRIRSAGSGHVRSYVGNRAASWVIGSNSARFDRRVRSA